MGILKRRLKQEEEGLDQAENEEMLDGELSDDSTTSEEEVELQDIELGGGAATTAEGSDGHSGKVKVMILASRGINAR